MGLSGIAGVPEPFASWECNPPVLRTVSPGPPAFGPSPLGPTGSNMRVLVAEDDAVTREILVAQLKAWEYDPVPVRDGLQALEHLRDPSQPFLAILAGCFPAWGG